MKTNQIRLVDSPWTTPDEGSFKVYRGDEHIGYLATGMRDREWRLRNLKYEPIAVFFGDRDQIKPLAIATIIAAL